MTRPSTTTDVLPERHLAAFGTSTGFEAIPEGTRHEAKRSLVNIIATTLAGCREPAVEIALQTLRPLSAGGHCTLVGRGEETDAGLATFVNAMSANIFDFDDTHEATIIHPAATVFAACLAQAQCQAVTGREFLRAFAIGCEVECRIGNAVSPGHYARGWHITSTCGGFGAAAAVGVLLGLDRERMLHALCGAAVQSSGLVETLGTMAKSVSVGAAARNGLLAARLAENGLTGPDAPLSGTRGWLRVYADHPEPQAIFEGLGDRWELDHNTYKPYPTGVVLNPVIDATLRLRAEHALSLADIASVEIHGHPLLRQRTDRPDVATGREAQVSAQHAITITLLRGCAGLDEFTDAAVMDTLRAGRPRITFVDDPERDVASVRMIVHISSAEPLHCTVAKALGSRGNPLSDTQLEAKLAVLAQRADTASTAIAAAIWRLEDQANSGSLMREVIGTSGSE